MKKNISISNVWVIVLGVLFVMGSTASPLMAQDYTKAKFNELDARMDAIEEYLKNLDSLLKEMSQNILKSVDRRIELNSNKVVALSPSSTQYTQISTNSGTFFIAVKGRKKIDDGYQLILNVGNPNAASYSGVNVTVRWGKKWDSTMVNPTYEEWRESLLEAKFEYLGTLDPGTWSEVSVNLIPADVKTFQYIEVEMEVSTVQLKMPSTNI